MFLNEYPHVTELHKFCYILFIEGLSRARHVSLFDTSMILTRVVTLGHFHFLKLLLVLMS
jgi:hypothetical protein